MNGRRFELAVAAAAAWTAFALAYLPARPALQWGAAAAAIAAAIGALAIRFTAVPPRLGRWVGLALRLLLIGIGALVVFARQFPLVRYDASRRTGAVLGSLLALAVFAFLGGRRAFRVPTRFVPAVAGVLVAAGMERTAPGFVPLAATAGLALWIDAFRTGGPRRLGAPVVASGAVGLALAGGIAWGLPIAQPHVQEMVARAYSEGRTGLSDRSELGDVASLAQSRRVVARVWTNRPQLLRMQVFSQFDGRRWVAFANDGKPMPRLGRRGLGPLLSSVPGNVFAAAEPVEGVFLNETRVLPGLWMDDGWGLLAPSGLDRIVWPHEGLVLDDRGLVTTGGATARLYGLVNRPLEGRRHPPTDLDLVLPVRLDPRVRALAGALGHGSAPGPDLVARTVEHLRTRYRYTLDVGRFQTTDPLAEFLFDKRAGYCEYFATAAVVLLRAQGVPARYVKGVNVRSDRRIGGHYVVRESDAHAWVDAWTADTGWIEMDPTPADGWARTHPDERPGTFEVLWERLSTWASQGWARLRQGAWPWLSDWLAVIGLGLADAVRDHGGVLALLSIATLGLLALRRRRPRETAPRVSDRAPVAPDLERVLRDVERHWERAGHPRPAARGLREHLAALPAGALTSDAEALSRRVVDAVYDSAFAGRPPAPDAVDALAQATRALGTGG